MIRVHMHDVRTLATRYIICIKGGLPTGSVYHSVIGLTCAYVVL